MKKMTPKELEKFIHQSLRSLPARRAPATLEARVMAAIEHQAAIAWYHKSWAHWPAAVRAGFLVLATGVSCAVVAAFFLGSNSLDTSEVATQAGARLGFLATIWQVATWIAGLGTQVISRIPPLWLYGGLATVAALYATFLSLGAAAYRTLYRNN